MSRYEVAKRVHLGPVGVSVPVGSIWAKYSPSVIRESGRLVFDSYNGMIEIGL
jgi:hypothetical protein